MGEKISWGYFVNIANGPSISVRDELEVEAYDKIQVTILDTATQKVDLMPAAASPVTLLIVNPANPDPGLSYEIGGNAIKLDAPHVLLGEGAVSLLGGATSLSIKNTTGADADVEILIGRDATPP
jgi:hypothetical protein